MSEREIRRILESVYRELDDRLRKVSKKVILPAAVGAALALSGCESNVAEPVYMAPHDAGAELASDAGTDLGPLPDYMAPDAGTDLGPLPDYMAPDAGMDAQPLYMGPDAATDLGPQPDYMAPDAATDLGPQPDYMAPDVLPNDVAVYMGPDADDV